MGLYNNANKVPYNQRAYQAAYRQHTRLWRIGPGSRLLITPYLIVLYGTVSVGIYGMGRKIFGYNTFI